MVLCVLCLCTYYTTQNTVSRQIIVVDSFEGDTEA